MAFSGSLEKMVVQAYSDDTFKKKVGEFTVTINPASYTHTYQIRYNDVTAQGSSGGSPVFNRTPSDVVTFQLVFDGTGVVPTALPGVLPYTGDGIVKQISDFRALVFAYNGNIHSPNFLILSWGTLLFRGRLQSFKVNYTLFKPDGSPLRAKVDVTVKGYNDETELALRANKSSPDLSHVVTVKAGDTLPLLCYGIYGSSEPYIKIAEVNGLSDFRDLHPGQQLLFPAMQSTAS
jgi:nucleoid-associated protein YgaU